VLSAAVRSSKGNLTVYVLNHTDSPKNAAIRLAGLEEQRVFYKYQVTEDAISEPGYRMDAMKSFGVSAGRPDVFDQLPKQSITVYSTYKLAHADPGITVD
jgi:hypothetical protein